MLWVLTSAAAVMFATTVLSFVVCALAWKRRSFPGGATLPLLLLAVAGWSLVAGLEAAFVPLEWKIFWSSLEYLGSGATGVLFLWFAAKYSGHDRWLRGRRHLALWIPTAVALALAATNVRHGWIWKDFLPGPKGSNSVIYIHGPAYFAVVAVVYVYIVTACALLLRSAFRAGVPRRRQTVTVLLAAALPVVSSVLYMIRPGLLGGLNVVPASFLATVIVFVLGLGFFRVFDLVPVARHALVERMPDAILVLNTEARIIDANPSAVTLLGLDDSAVGRTASEAIPAWPHLGLACSQQEERHVELTLSDDPLRYVDVRVTPLYEAGPRGVGCLIVMRDITKRYEAETALQQANEQLRSHVRQIEKLQGELREQAIRDSLTGLFNRRYLDETLPRELARASREAGIVAAIMIDIDHFKEVNDRRGHREGDRLLSLLGALLRERTRPSDIACRYGGEEFLIVLPGASVEAARVRIEEIRREYALRLRTEGFAEPPTLSAGVAVFPTHARSDDELLRAADDALYRAKREGRDRVRIAAETGDTNPNSDAGDPESGAEAGAP
ncbi:MAG: diguanylate cyclase [Candidatus Bipolaricaulis sp.]|nr:diguanylate cyclase [Candidatus Bipolaricaulis sp.]